MDPNANIEQQRECAAKILAELDGEQIADSDTVSDNAERLAELVIALDEWRQGGGFDPYLKPEDAIDALEPLYKPKMMALLQRAKEACEEAGLPCDEPGDMSADEYRVSLAVWRSAEDRGDGEHGDYDKCINVDVLIAESREYDGENPYGINFSVDIVESGGRILGGLSPFNYTDRVWVDARDPEAVSDRWDLIEEADISEIPNLIKEDQ